MKRKGIILAGGNGTRLYPLTLGVSKQLMPIYNKPMIFYPLSTLMLAGIKEFLIITNLESLSSFKNLLSDGSDYGISIEYAAQEKPEGLAQAFLIGEDFLDESPAALILGDNLFYGDNFVSQLKRANESKNSTIFVCPVSDPERYGVAEFDKNSVVINLVEKPKRPLSRYAVTGLYFYDKTVVEKAKQVEFSHRGELEITSLNNIYLKDKSLKVEILGRGMAWLDTGTFDSLHQAGSFIRTIEKRQGLMIGCPTEVALRNNWISTKQVENNIEKFSKSGYGTYLKEILKNTNK
ncbi:MAG: glucose-1-phosphate thymidylyltransferase [Flavobacteriales bacterium]|nr:glucose-1-phosphate thymidylyltransferase [Flavobacteriales bacterium]